MKRFREWDSFPGFPIDGITARRFAKGMAELDLPPLRFDESNSWWKVSESVIRGCVELSRGKYIVGCPDLVENMDVHPVLLKSKPTGKERTPACRRFETTEEPGSGGRPPEFNQHHLVVGDAQRVTPEY